jgi:hypothetical protein
LSYYADHIASGAPAEVTLSRIALHPVKNKIRNSEEIRFSRNNIIISGQVNNSVILNEWIKRIKKEEWVKKINLADYNQESFSHDGAFNIEVEIAE